MCSAQHTLCLSPFHTLFRRMPWKSTTQENRLQRLRRRQYVVSLNSLPQFVHTDIAFHTFILAFLRCSCACVSLYSTVRHVCDCNRSVLVSVDGVYHPREKQAAASYAKTHRARERERKLNSNRERATRDIRGMENCRSTVKHEWENFGKRIKNESRSAQTQSVPDVFVQRWASLLASVALAPRCLCALSRWNSF